MPQNKFMQFDMKLTDSGKYLVENKALLMTVGHVQQQCSTA